MEEINITKRTDIYSVDPRNVVVVDNFNVRRDFAIDELKEQIKAQGVLNPITVVPFKDEDGNEKYRLVDGERRLRATLAAIAEGADIKRVKAIFLPRNTKEEDLLIEQMMRNEGKNFTEYEQAIMFQRFRDKFGYTQSEIAAKFCKSATFIGRCLSLLDLAPAIQEKLEKGEISTGAVRQIVGLNKEDEGAQIAAVENAVADAKSKGKTTATGKNISGETKSQKDLKKVVEAFKLLISSCYAAHIPVELLSMKQVCASLHDATTMEDVTSKLGLIDLSAPAEETEGTAEVDEKQCEVEKADEDNMKSLQKQFEELKAKSPDAILLFRRGDFYEVLNEDAKPVADTLGITLTVRKDGMQMTGFPHHALDTYLPKLVRAGLRVAICDQLDDPKMMKLAKGGSGEISTSNSEK